MNKSEYLQELKLLKTLKEKKLVIESRTDFFSYCKLRAPDFYRDDIEYLKTFATELQEFVESDENVIIINMPPRHGKSRTAGNLVEWILGKQPHKKIMLGSYNEVVARTFSRKVRNTIQEEGVKGGKPVFQDVFPDVKIKYGEGASDLWALDGHDSSYLATSPTGTATGFGADYIIIDDLIKSAQQAFNARVLQEHWDWFRDTMLSRLESGGKIIIVMTRWHTKDLAGRIMEEFPDLGYKVRTVIMKALQDDGTMLAPEILNREEYNLKSKTQSQEIVEANYNQEPVDIKGKLYAGGFNTYKPNEIPEFQRIMAYTDTADTGKDYLCTVIFGVTMDNKPYMLDVVYTQEPMAVTEQIVADRMKKNNVHLAIFESNNGGYGYARQVLRKYQEKFGNGLVVKPLTQRQNKVSRILSSSSWLMENLAMPYDWRIKWNEYYTAMDSYQKEGKNEHDDAPDATTGIYDVLVNQGKKNDVASQIRTIKGLGL